MLWSNAQFRILQVAGTARLALVVLSLCGVSLAQLPDECKPQGVSEEAIRDSPTKIYGLAGARFAGQGNLKCALPLFEEVVRLEQYSAQAHYNLGVAYERVKQLDSETRGRAKESPKANCHKRRRSVYRIARPRSGS